MITVFFLPAFAKFRLSECVFRYISLIRGSRIFEHDQEMPSSVGGNLDRAYFEIYFFEFTVAFDLYVFLSDRSSLLLLFCFVDRSLQIEQQPFSSHLQYVEAGSAGRELKIEAHVSTGFKDFHVVINHHGDGSV